MRKSIASALFCGVLFFLTVVGVAAHGRLAFPAPRVGSGGSRYPGAKLTPLPVGSVSNTCGGTPNSDPGPLDIQAVFQAGSNVTVYWQTSIYHAPAPGVRIAVSYSDTDSFDDNVLVNGLDIGQVGCHNYTVTLNGSKISDKAVLQWIWASNADGGYYLGCSGPVLINNSYAFYNSACTTMSPTPAPTPTTSSPITSGSSTSSESVGIVLTQLLASGALIAFVLF